MRIVYEEFREWNPYTDKEEFVSGELRLVCKSYKEFKNAWEKIKDVDGVFWSGCPYEDEKEYSDIIVSVKRSRSMTIKDVKEEIAYIRQNIKHALKKLTKEVLKMNFTIGNNYLVNYGNIQKVATYKGYNTDDNTHVFFDGSGANGVFGFSESFIKSGKITITELITD